MRFQNKSLSRALRSTLNPTHAALAMLFGGEEELVFRLFFRPTDHHKTTMSMGSFEQDASGLKSQLEQHWLERKKRKAENTETEFGEWRQIR